MTAELIPAAPQAERAIANVLRRTAIRVPNPEPDQAVPAMRARKARNRALRRTTSAQQIGKKCCRVCTTCFDRQPRNEEQQH